MTGRAGSGGGRPRRGSRDGGAGALPRELVAELEATGRRGRSARAIHLLEGAVAALEQGREGEAARLAEEAKALAPRAGGPREVLGLAYYQAERFREALRELQTYRRMTGRSDHNHVIADCHRALGAPEKAVPLVQEALRAPIPEPSRAEAAVVGGAALADMGRYDEAVALLRRFRSPSGEARTHDLRVWYVLGDVLERAGRREEAAREFRRILRHDPEAFDTAERLARLP